MLIISCPCSCDYFLSLFVLPVFVHAHTTPCMEALRLTGMPLSFVHILVSHVVSLSSRVLYSVIGLLNFYRCKHAFTRTAVCH